MAIRGFKRKFKPLKLITEEEVDSIHTASLEILKNTGVKFDSKWALDFFKKNDCAVDFENKIVKFPEGLVEECIRKAPSTYTCKAREEKYDMVYNKDIVYFQDAPAMHTFDFKTQTTRIPTKQEYADYVKVLDFLPTVHSLSAYPYFGCTDISPVMIMPELMAIKFKNTSKFHQTPYSNDSEIFCIKMAKVVGMEIMGCTVMVAPLVWQESAVNQARRFVEAGFPVSPGTASTLGATGPATIAGSVAKSNAELMAMLVLVQLLKPGQRVLMWHIDWPQNMKTGSPAFGQIGAALGFTIFNQMWCHYGIPAGDATVGFGNAKTPDFQSGYERGIGAILAALSGCSLIQFHGCIMGELAGHPAQAVLDDDIAGMVGRYIEGEEVNFETLAVDLIKEVGPAPGHYLGACPRIEI